MKWKDHILPLATVLTSILIAFSLETATISWAISSLPYAIARCNAVAP